MQFYCYKGEYELGKEPLGTAYRHIWKDLKTTKGALKRAGRLYKNSFRLYSYSNFYDNTSFRKVF